ncbi:2Fe-2S iron-sulfur cluster-binding protein [Streptomyces sp. NPDC057794]|uniref:2Fe-2S iron-sulfur cluster-binding protein n=1 Tax=Streptomyces sp. NPDC057794 TaxID=3346251 RepID=UPI00369FF882
MNTAAAPAPPGSSPRTRWHRLRVTDVRRPTAGTVAVTLDVPAALRTVFAHRPGRHVVVRHRAGDAELRRSYSLCPPPYAPETLRLVIGRGRPDGFGAHAATRLAPGDHLELSPPTGSFALPDLPGAHHVLLGGGTGITPLAPMATHALRRDPACRVTLVHSVRTSADALLADELALVKDEFVDRLAVLHVLTREERGSGGGPLAGRLDAGALRRLLAAVDARPGRNTTYALCGPPGLVDTARQVLAEEGAAPSRVRWELFTPGDTPRQAPQQPATSTPAMATTPATATAPPPETAAAVAAAPATEAASARVTALLDGRRRTATVLPGDPVLLDALLRAHPDVPYACREGVCGSCRARVLSGRVTADGQHALDERDRAAGYTLVCRARPATPDLTLDFDA